MTRDRETDTGISGRAANEPARQRRLQSGVVDDRKWHASPSPKPRAHELLPRASRFNTVSIHCTPSTTSCQRPLDNDSCRLPVDELPLRKGESVAVSDLSAAQGGLDAYDQGAVVGAVEEEMYVLSIRTSNKQ